MSHLSAGILAIRKAYTVTSPFTGYLWVLSSSRHRDRPTASFSLAISSVPRRPGRSTGERRTPVNIRPRKRSQAQGNNCGGWLSVLSIPCLCPCPVPTLPLLVQDRTPRDMYDCRVAKVAVLPLSWVAHAMSVEMYRCG